MPLPAPLTPLDPLPPYRRLACVVVSSATWRRPAWSGSMLRGAFGWALAEVAGQAPAPDWPGLVVRDLATALFDPQTAWASPRAVPVFDLELDRPGLRVDDLRPLRFSLGLWGALEPWVEPLLGEALARMAERGLGPSRIPCRLESIEPTTLSPLTMPQAASACSLTTRSPARLKEAGQPLRSLCPSAIARSLVRRHRALAIQLLGHDPYQATGAHLHHLAGQLDSRRMLCRQVHLERRSSRQGRHAIPDAVVGKVEIVGASLPSFLPLLAAAPRLRIGRQPNFGLGAVEVHFLPAFEPGCPVRPPAHRPKAQQHPATRPEDQP